MRNTIFLIMISVSANASPYFRLIDPAHPDAVLGALIDPADVQKTEASSLIPIFTHSPKDGCLLPSIVCEDWTPLSIGASVNSGHVTFDVAPLINVLPWVQSAAMAIVPGNWGPVQRVLSSNIDHSVSFSAGPVWQYQQLTNKGYFKIFTGLALQF